MDYTFSFTSSKDPQLIFETLLDVQKWWVGLFGEEIKGKSTKLNDEFTFKAGDGLHYSKQRLIELVPGKRIVWEVIESNLTFLKHPEEWKGSKIRFDLVPAKTKITVVFTHEGLKPKIECYGACSGAWTQYMKNLERILS